MNGINEAYNNQLLHYVGGGNVFDILGIRRSETDSQDETTEGAQDGTSTSEQDGVTMEISPEALQKMAEFIVQGSGEGKHSELLEQMCGQSAERQAAFDAEVTYFDDDASECSEATVSSVASADSDTSDSGIATASIVATASSVATVSNDSIDDIVSTATAVTRPYIANSQTDALLRDGLDGADTNVRYAAYTVIRNYLMPSSVGDMTEEERQDAIAFGLSLAQYIADNYLDEDHAETFMDAMTRIAQYGMNGTVDEDGKVTYNVQKGPLVGAPDDYVNEWDWLKVNDPDLYDQLVELSEHPTGPEDGKAYIELMQKALAEIYGPSSTGEGTNYDVAVKEYTDWKDEMTSTELPTVFLNANYSTWKTLFESLVGSGSSLSTSWISENMNNIVKYLANAE